MTKLIPLFLIIYSFGGIHTTSTCSYVSFFVSSFGISRSRLTIFPSPYQVTHYNQKGLILFSDNKIRIMMTREGNDNYDEEEYDDDDNNDEDEDYGGPQSINVLGTPLECCCANVRNGIGTGFYRNGYCSTGADDLGRHTVCVQVTDDFLTYSKNVGNDLSTPVPQYLFPGLQEGDLWCLCAQRWVQAYNDGMAPKLYLQATHEKTLTYVPIEILRMYALDGNEADEVKQSLDEQRAKLNDLFND